MFLFCFFNVTAPPAIYTYCHTLSLHDALPISFYGDSLPAFIETFSPTASVPYLADVARLEMLRVRAYHAADSTPLSTDAIARFLADTDTLPLLRVALSPSLFLLRSRYAVVTRSEEHTSELQSLMRISYAVFCLKKKKKNKSNTINLQ